MMVANTLELDYRELINSHVSRQEIESTYYTLFYLKNLPGFTSVQYQSLDVVVKMIKGLLNDNN